MMPAWHYCDEAVAVLSRDTSARLGGWEGEVGEPALLQIGPDELDGIQLWRKGWQFDDFQSVMDLQQSAYLGSTVNGRAIPHQVVLSRQCTAREKLSDGQ